MTHLFHCSVPLAVAGAIVAGAIGLVSTPAVADDSDHKSAIGATDHAHDATNIWAISRGGQLYDKWWAVIEGDEPKTTHSAYPKAGKQKGSATWRCKECHGWDYKGVDGAYAKGSHFSGTKGVRGVVDIDPGRIHEILQDKTHGFTTKHMPHSAMEKLALFLSLGQIDMDVYIDRATKKARGDPRRGAQFYQTICANCHGFDGKELNFGDEKKPEFVGTVCAGNPWEALHKIRFGQPGVGMVSLSVLGVQEQVNILSYCQTLPVK